MTNDTEPRSQIVILCADLMFQSQITGAARLQGFSFSCALSLSQAIGQLTDEFPQVLIIDLNQPELDWEVLAATLQKHPQLTSIAYGPHIDTDKLQQARDSGCDQVLPRSQFSANLPRILKTALSPDD
ncbi:Response regulator receiver domain protein [Gimesia panareensis]|uniref:Response regulator receiver domain protein n=1 Tax=Gimesia panareensis TaxID=2527978 RepID=A0A517Q688_9PLAN|nr:hypothetical protein [Gimesia panareensis]QDT27106.1 Response regulator receiver domain protein [Gimesia panareensis]